MAAHRYIEGLFNRSCCELRFFLACSLTFRGQAFWFAGQCALSPHSDAKEHHNLSCASKTRRGGDAAGI
jgi:hypothetical protein